MGLALSAYLVACIGPQFDSVHFYDPGWYGGKIEYDFGRLPQEYNIPGWNNELVRAGTNSADEVLYSTDIDGLADQIYSPNEPKQEIFHSIGNRDSEEEFWYGSPNHQYWNRQKVRVHHARNLEASGQFREANRAYQSLSASLNLESFVRDRQELIDAGCQPKTKGYAEYLRLRYLMEFGLADRIDRAAKSMAKLDADERIKPHIAYALADDAVPTKPGEILTSATRSRAYAAVAKKYPKSKRAEPALIMAARNSFEAKDWAGGMEYVSILQKQFPHTRFQDNIEGWQGSYRLAKGDWYGAISHYVRQSKSKNPREARKGYMELAHFADIGGKRVEGIIHLLHARSLSITQHQRENASKEIRDVFQNLDAKGLERLQERIAEDAVLLQSYLSFRMSDTAMNPKSERRLLRYVSRSLAKLDSFPRSFATELSELEYRAGLYSDALQHAKRGQKAPFPFNVKAQFIVGSSLERLGNHSGAMQTYEALIRRDSPKYIQMSAMEHLALLNEKHGDAARAYELYRDLGHRDDVSFLVDSELTPNQIHRLIERSSDHQERSILKFSLAMRYFRREQYSEAKAALRSLPQELRIYRGLSGPTYVSIYKDLWFDPDAAIPPIDPMQDVLTMEKLRKSAERARTQESRAEALYSMIRFTHSKRNLIFYSPGLWFGGRSSSYGLYWNKQINKGEFDRIALRGAFEQECEAQTAKFCKELIRRCPESSLVPKAMYTAGVSLYRLSNFNSYWRTTGDHLNNTAIKYMRRLAQEYPKHELAKNAKKYADVWSGEEQPEY